MNKKSFCIAVDCEGPACVVGTPGIGLRESPNYPFAAKQAMREANAAARALFDAGAEKVLIWDNHSSGVNLDYDQIDPRCDIALGTNLPVRFPGVDQSFGGVLFIGYHAREGTLNAVIAHTFNSAMYQHQKVNGREVGELEIDAAFAGIHGVPVLFAASDRACVLQAKESFPWIETVETKVGLGWNAAVSLHPKAACEAIYNGVMRAAERLDEMKPFTFTLPLEYEIRYKRIDSAGEARLYDRERRPFRFADAFTRVGVLDRVEDLMN